MVLLSFDIVDRVYTVENVDDSCGKFIGESFSYKGVLYSIQQQFKSLDHLSSIYNFDQVNRKVVYVNFDDIQ